jgi:hypothetical protein
MVVALHGLPTVKRKTEKWHKTAVCKMKENLENSTPCPAM